MRTRTTIRGPDDSKIAQHGIQQKANDDAESMRLLAEMYPTLEEENLREILDAALLVQDSKETVEYFREMLEASKWGVMFGATTPPPNADLKWFDFDVHRIFYHSLYPPNHPNPDGFSWSFYIGKRGEGVESIIEDAIKLYDIKLLSMVGTWSPCVVGNVLADTKIRIYRQGSEVQELSFPPDPHKKNEATVYRLPA
ncbi:hypothetical protein DFH06DRAFT_711531 [Mycena polygramma]|nr:hypothetical protein DFH06DRAFT_711531 [Mycena polygramma]